MTGGTVDRLAVHQEMAEARSDFHRSLATSSVADLRRPSAGTRWTNEQLLFHMLFGYVLVRTLLPLVRFFAHLPPRFSRAFAFTLDCLNVPFHVINYLGSCGGSIVVNHRRMAGLLDHILVALDQSLDEHSEADLQRGMHFPTRWDPCFKEWMTVSDVYHFGTQHFRAHRRQLTL